MIRINYFIKLIILITLSLSINNCSLADRTNYENAQGFPSGIDSNWNEIFYENIQIDVTYPVEISFNSTAKVKIAVSNDKDSTWDYVRISVHGNEEYYDKDLDYFNGFEVRTSDRQFISSGEAYDGWKYFDTSIIEKGEKINLDLSFHAINSGGYRGKINVCLSNGDTFVCYELPILTIVTN